MGHHPSGSSSSNHEGHGFYPPPSFEENSSFQMNPLSSHPPRTPRASLVSAHSHVYGTNIYESTEEEGPSRPTEEELEEDEAKVKELERKVRKEDIWREMLLTSTGRDKAFVSLSCSSTTTMSYDKVMPLETTAIRDTRLLAFPLISDNKFTPPESIPKAMGERNGYTALVGHEWPIVLKVKSAANKYAN